MDLYKIMLVDDEEDARKGIISSIDWEKAGFTLVADAENGEEAKEKIETFEPNVIITDVQMPYMNGLELAKWVQQKYPSIKVLVLSGYGQFDYAQEAMRYGVKEYLLKPIEHEGFYAALKKVKESLDEEIRARKNIDLLKENFVVSLPLLREQFLNKLLNNSEIYHFNEDEIDVKLKRYEIDLAGAREWLVIAVDVDDIGDSSEFDHNSELMMISVKNFIKEKLENDCRYVFLTSAMDSRPVLIVAMDNDEEGNPKLTLATLMDLLNDSCREAMRTMGVKLTFGVGSAQESLTVLDESYKEAMNALGYMHVNEEESVIYIQDVEPVKTGVLKLDEKEQNDIVSVIKFGPQERMVEVIDKIHRKMTSAKVHSRQTQVYILSIVSCILGLMQQSDVSLDKISDYKHIITKTPDADEFRDWMTKTCTTLNGMMQQKRETTTKQIIKDAKEYIAEHYKNVDLSVEMICKHLHMSPAYFSTLFKKEMNQTYVAYLTDMRLNKAVELLNSTDYKTYVIAEMVGYQEQNYFSYVFKKKFGVPPTKYRSSGSKSNEKTDK